jgi:hypothetical protein
MSGDEPMTKIEEREETLICRGCQRAIEWCSFCDEDDCAAAVCFYCLVVALGESAPRVHTHGG